MRNLFYLTRIVMVIAFLASITGCTKSIQKKGSQELSANKSENSLLECGECIPDPSSPSGGSKYCKFGNEGSWIPCALDEDPPSTICLTLSGVDLVLTTNDIPVCCPIRITTWNEIVNNQYGISGRDIETHYISDVTATRFHLGIPGWRPFDVFKQTICGELYSFSIYKDFSLFEIDRDWNNKIYLDPAFHQLYYDAKNRIANTYGEDELHNWYNDGPGREEIIKGEISPDLQIYPNPWFQANGESSLQDSCLCIYGPFVMDVNHDHHPEIHPSELFWWNTNFGDGYDLFTMMQISDKSFRFHEKSQFEYAGNNWKPWAAVPRKNKFLIAFELNPNLENIEFQIVQPFDSKEVRTKDYNLGIKDDANKNRHTLTYNGKIIVDVFESIEKDEDLDIGFVKICRNETGNRLQGYLQIVSIVDTSDNENTKGGYNIISVVKEKKYNIGVLPPPDFEKMKLKLLNTPRVIIPPRLTVSGEVLLESIQKRDINGEPQLLGDMQVQFKKAGLIKNDTLFVKSVKLITSGDDLQLTYLPNKLKNGGIVKNLPLIGTDKLEFTMSSGLVLRQAAGGISISPMTANEKPLNWSKANSSLRNLYLAAGIPTSKQKLVTLEVQRVNGWELEAIPFYAPIFNGEIWPEEESPLTEEINNALLKGDQTFLEKIFGVTTSKISVTWQVRITNLTTQQNVNSKTSRNELVEFVPGILPDAKVIIKFPDDNRDDIYKARAIAEMRDSFGNIGKVEYTVWSHGIKIKSEQEIENLLKAVADISGVDSHELLLASRIDDLSDPNNDPLIEEPYFRRARMVRLQALRAARDKRISIGELKGLIDNARWFENRSNF